MSTDDDIVSHMQYRDNKESFLNFNIFLVFSLSGCYNIHRRFGTKNKEVQQKLAENNITLHAAYERLTTVSSDEKLRILALNREKAIRDWNSSIHYAEQHGRAQGEQIGKEQINKLNQRLLTDNRFDDLKRSISDHDFQKQLLKEYGLEK